MSGGGGDDGHHSSTRVKPTNITGPAKKTLNNFQTAGVSIFILIVVGLIAFNIYQQAVGARRGGGQNVAIQTTTIPAQPSSAAPAGCRGPEPTIRMQPGQEYVLPEFCRFDFNVVGGTITLQGTDGATIDVARGQTVHFPTGFHPTRMWSATGAEVQASFFRM